MNDPHPGGAASAQARLVEALLQGQPRALARAITGVWRTAGGKIRLDGAALDQYDPDVLGQLIGYLPQRVTLFEGTIAENISRLEANPDPAAIVTAAQTDAGETLQILRP